MTEKQKSEVIRMRSQGMSFSQMSDITGVSRNTIKSFCRRRNITAEIQMQTEDKSDKMCCKQCGKKLNPLPGKKTPKFCGTECRTKWWNAHPEAVNRKAIYTFNCACCGEPFTAYGNKDRKYCSHSCYIQARFKVGDSNG